MNDDQPQRCIGCGRHQGFGFALFMIITTRGIAPRLRANTRAIAICADCTKPNSADYSKLKNSLAVMVLGLQNQIGQQRRKTGGRDGKAAAAGS